jgi:nitroreductase
LKLDQAILERRTISAFEPTAQVPDAWVQEALDLARWAPNHKQTWPFRFVWVGPATRAQLVPLRIKAKAGDRPPSDALVARITQATLSPTHLIAVCQRLAQDPVRRQEDRDATAAAIQTLLLALTARGLGSMWGTGGLLRAAETLDLLQVDAASEELVAFVWIGLPASRPAPPARPELDRLLTRLP